MNLLLVLDVLISAIICSIFYAFIGWEWMVLLGFFFIPIIMKATQLIDWLMLTSGDAKTLKEAANQKATLVLVAFDDGTHDLQYVKHFVPEGAIKTNKNLTFALARPKTFPEPNPTTNGGTPTGDLMSLINHLATIKPILRQSKIPILVAYAGKAIATTVEGIMAVQGNIYKLTPASLTELKHLFPQMWNISTIRGIERDSEDIGYKKHEKTMGNFKLLIYGIIALAIFGIAAMLVIKFFG
jgi:hypothetical protein